MGSYIYCMVDSNNEYDYSIEGMHTNDKEVVSWWFNCGVREVVMLDGYSMGILGRYTKEDWERSME